MERDQLTVCLATDPPVEEVKRLPSKFPNRSEQIDLLATALSAAQGDIENAVKDSRNPFFHSSYADLASVWDACRKPLSDNGLAVLQLPQTEFTGEPVFEKKVTRAGDERWEVKVITLVKLRTWLVHSSGQWVESALETYLPSGDPQSLGSAIKYLRRYALEAIAGVAAADDDAEGAMGRREEQVKSGDETQAEKIARVKREAGKSPEPRETARETAGGQIAREYTEKATAPAVPASTQPGPADADRPVEQPGTAAPVLVVGINTQSGPIVVKDGKSVPAWGPLYIIAFNGKVRATDGTLVTSAMTYNEALAVTAEGYRDKTLVFPNIVPGKKKGTYALEGFEVAPEAK